MKFHCTSVLVDAFEHVDFPLENYFQHSFLLFMWLRKCDGSLSSTRLILNHWLLNTIYSNGFFYCFIFHISLMSLSWYCEYGSGTGVMSHIPVRDSQLVYHLWVFLTSENDNCYTFLISSEYNIDTGTLKWEFFSRTIKNMIGTYMTRKMIYLWSVTSEMCWMNPIFGINV